MKDEMKYNLLWDLQPFQLQMRLPLESDFLWACWISVFLFLNLTYYGRIFLNQHWIWRLYIMEVFEVYCCNECDLPLSRVSFIRYLKVVLAQNRLNPDKYGIQRSLNFAYSYFQICGPLVALNRIYICFSAIFR